MVEREKPIFDLLHQNSVFTIGMLGLEPPAHEDVTRAHVEHLAPQYLGIRREYVDDGPIPERQPPVESSSLDSYHSQMIDFVNPFYNYDTEQQAKHNPGYKNMLLHVKNVTTAAKGLQKGANLGDPKVTVAAAAIHELGVNAIPSDQVSKVAPAELSLSLATRLLGLPSEDIRAAVRFNDENGYVNYLPKKSKNSKEAVKTTVENIQAAQLPAEALLLTAADKLVGEIETEISDIKVVKDGKLLKVVLVPRFRTLNDFRANVEDVSFDTYARQQLTKALKSEEKRLSPKGVVMMAALATLFDGASTVRVVTSPPADKVGIETEIFSYSL